MGVVFDSSTLFDSLADKLRINKSPGYLSLSVNSVRRGQFAVNGSCHVIFVGAGDVNWRVRSAYVDG